MFQKKTLGLSIVLFILFAVSAHPSWAGEPPTDDTPKVAKEIMVEGKVTLMDYRGSYAYISNKAGGKGYVLLGELGTEIQGLRYAVIKVWGVKDKNILQYQTLVVHRYEILTIDGKKPYFGTLESKDGKAYLHIPNTGKAFELSGSKNQISALTTGHSKKAWVIGEISGNTLTVKKYKVL